MTDRRTAAAGWRSPLSGFPWCPRRLRFSGLLLRVRRPRKCLSVWWPAGPCVSGETGSSWVGATRAGPGDVAAAVSPVFSREGRRRRRGLARSPAPCAGWVGGSAFRLPSASHVKVDPGDQSVPTKRGMYAGESFRVSMATPRLSGSVWSRSGAGSRFLLGFGKSVFMKTAAGDTGDGGCGHRPLVPGTLSSAGGDAFW